MRIPPFLIACLAALGAVVPEACGQTVPEPPLPGEVAPESAGLPPVLEPGHYFPEGTAALPDNPAFPFPFSGEESGPPGLSGDAAGMPGPPETEFFDEDVPLPPEFEDEIIGPKLQPRKNIRLPDDPLRPLPLPGAQPGAEVEPPNVTPRAEWIRNPRKARKISIEQSKPLLLFFACIFDSTPVDPVTKRSMVQPTAALNDDLLTTVEFNEFASQKLVLALLHFPSNSQRNAKPEVYTRERLAALERFKKHFKVRGFPCLILLDEEGNEIERISGYRRASIDGSRELYSTAHVIIDRLKVAVERLDARRAAKRERLENLAAQGYRLWTSRSGHTLFAGFVGVNREVVVLRDESGRRRRIRHDELSIIDRAWIHRKRTNTLPPPRTDPPAPPGKPPDTAGEEVPTGLSLSRQSP